MNIGTKSLLFGLHQFVLHPALVTLAWWKLYRHLPTLREAVCIGIHDWGYWGLPNIDGPEGEQHPLWAGRFSDRTFGHAYGDLCRFHSGTIAERFGVQPSKLCIPDKYGSALAPAWLLTILGGMTGETKELKTAPKYARHRRQGMTDYQMYVSFKTQYMKEKVRPFQVSLKAIQGG